MKQLEKDLTTNQKLLRAAYQILEKQNNTGFTYQTSVWDGVTCDHYCLLEEIGNYLDEKNVDADYVPEVAEGEE